MISLRPSMMTWVVSWWAPGMGMATVSWSFASYTFTGGDSIAACFAITAKPTRCKITARYEPEPATTERGRVAARRPAGRTAHGALSTGSPPRPGCAGAGSPAGGHRGRTTRHASGEAGADWFVIADRYTLLRLVSGFCLRRRAPTGHAPELPRPNVALVKQSMDASPSPGRAATTDGRGGRVGSRHARGAALRRTGI